MPRYDFQCAECGEQFEVQCSWREKDKVSCPNCASQKVEEIFRGVFSFFGSGSGSGSGSCGGGGDSYGGSCGFGGFG